MSGPPPTARGHDARELVSWLQKAIRRGLTDDALYAACELERSGYGAWLWRRLRIIAAEDIGPAWPEAMAAVDASYRTYADLKAAARKPIRHRPWRLVLTNVVIVLAQAPKSRAADWSALHYFGPLVERREVPDYALDRHTSAGRRMGRGFEHFVAEATVLHPHAPVEGEERWRELAADALQAGGPQPDVEPSGQSSLFE